MCPLHVQATRILRHWSEDRRRARGSLGFDPVKRERQAVQQYCTEAVNSVSSQEQKGSVIQYVERAFQKLHSCKSPAGVEKWVDSQKRTLLQEKLKHRVQTERWKRSMTDLQVKQVSGGLQVPLMLTLMRQAGMSASTVEFVRTIFTEGADYGGQVSLTGLYDQVPPDKEWGKYEYQEPPVLRKSVSYTHLTLPTILLV